MKEETFEEYRKRTGKEFSYQLCSFNSKEDFSRMQSHIFSLLSILYDICETDEKVVENVIISFLDSRSSKEGRERSERSRDLFKQFRSSQNPNTQ